MTKTTLPKVYIETSIVSYLTARHSSNLTASAWQKETNDWWDTQRTRFSLCISDVVIEESSRGDPIAAKKRLNVLANIETLPINQNVTNLAQALINEGCIPQKSLDDALHIAVAAVHGIDYLLTWNCRHIDNAEIKPKVRKICRNYGFECPEIATPIELMGVGIND